jgi:predicted NACHT family NTPase
MTFEELVALGGAWAWATYAKEVIAAIGKKLAVHSGDKAKEVIGAGWDRVEWKLAAKKYRAQIRNRHGTIRILGRPSPVLLEGIFTDVVMLDRPTALSRFDITKLRSDPKRLEASAKRTDGLKLVKDHIRGNRLFILGGPGAGKTTFLKHLAIQATNGVLDNIPIFVSLKEWGDSEQALMPFLCKQFKICGFPDAQPFIEHILEKGDAIVMFDGLDEVTQEGQRRDTLISEVRDFSDQYSKTQCLITCRRAATQYIFEKYTYYELADFTDKQIFTFVKKWFAEERKKLKLFKRNSTGQRTRDCANLARCLSFYLCCVFHSKRP